MPAPETPPETFAPGKSATAWEQMEALPLSTGARMGAAIGVVVVAAVAVLVSLPTAVMSLLMAYFVTAALGRLALGLAVLQVPRRSALVVAGGLAWVVLAVVLLVFVPVWERQGEEYSAGLGKLAGHVEKFAGVQDKAPVWADRGVTAVTGAIHSMTREVAGRRIPLFFQLALLVGVLLAAVLLRPWEPAAKLFTTIFSKAELWAASRWGKALALGLVAGIGLAMGGVPAAWFVAGWALALGWLLRATPLLTVLLAAPMLPWDESVIQAAAFVVGTGVVMFLAEKKLHWYLYRRPGLASGLILPEIHDAQGGAGAGVFGGGATIVRMVVTLVVLGLIAAALWVFVPSYQQQRERTQEIETAVALVERGKAEAATKKLLELEQKFPNETEVLLSLAKAYAQDRAVTNAMRYAALYAGWKPKPAVATTTREKLYQKFLRIFQTGTPTFNPAEGYKYMLSLEKTGESASELQRDLALKALALNPDSLPAISMMIKESILRNQPDEAVAYAEHAVKLDPRGRGRNLQVAEAYAAKKDWARVVVECDAELAIDPDNDRAGTLRKIAVQARDQIPK